MSKPIKFRLYSKFAKKYIDYITIGFSKTGELRSYSTENGVGPVLEDSYIVEQYTGLKDKNGKAIYEGDIVKQLMYVLEGKKCTTTWVVRWNNDEFCYDLHRVSGALYGDSMLSTCESKDCEVIGNIHESNMEENNEN